MSATWVESNVDRDDDGKFAKKTHADPGQVSGLKDAEEHAPEWFGRDLSRFSDLPPYEALDNIDASAVRLWNADGDRSRETELDAVPDDIVRLSIARHPASHSSDVSVADADRHYGSVVAEALRLHGVECAITGGQQRKTGSHRNTGALHPGGIVDAAVVAKAVRKDIQHAQTEGLLPPGVSRVRSSKFSMGQSVTATLYLPDHEAYVRDQWGRMERPTAFAGDVSSVLGRIVNSRNDQDVDSQSDYWNVDYFGDARVRSVGDL